MNLFQLEGEVAVDGGARGAVEGPCRRRLRFGEGRETEEKGDETTHLRLRQGRGGRGSAERLFRVAVRLGSTPRPGIACRAAGPLG